MSVLKNRPVLRWGIPAGIVVVLVGGGAALGVLEAAADPILPARSAAQLLVDVQTARLDGMSGTVVTRADLGLPALPSFGASPAAGLSLTSMLSGTHTLRVWYSGPKQARVALLGTLGETDLITNGTDLWTWDSQANKATHTTLPNLSSARGGSDATPGTSTPSPDESLATLTPLELANKALAAIDPTTVVTTQGTASIAGRDAYELVLSPRDTTSLIGSVRVAIDATVHVPLRVQVYARGASSPALEVAFTQISFARPDASEFTFNPPLGATVTEGSGKLTPAGADKLRATVQKAKTAVAGHTAVVGKGWTSVLVLRVGNSDAARGTGAGAAPTPTDAPGSAKAGLIGALNLFPEVSGAWGSGHVFQTTLVTVLITDDGRILIGAVSPAAIETAAADPAAKL
jgi:outer membrane lipoprotein-sorting protein